MKELKGFTLQTKCLYSGIRNDSYHKEGKVGKNCDSANAHEIEIGFGYNGSGPEAFGGSKEWTVLKASVSFQEHERERAKSFAKKLAKLINEEFKDERI